MSNKTNYEKIRELDIEQLAEFLNEHGEFDNSPWTRFFDREYCGRCEAVSRNAERDVKYSWCELHGGVCKYFPEMQTIPDGKDVVRIWLESEEE